MSSNLNFAAWDWFFVRLHATTVDVDESLKYFVP